MSTLVTLIENLDFVATVDAQDRVLRNASVLIAGARIEELARHEEVMARIGERPIDRRIDGRRLGMIPGLIDAHVHFSETLSRAVFPDVLSTRAWVFHWAKPFYAHVNEEDEKIGVALGIAEMLRSGTTCFLDMGAQNDAGLTAQTAGALGIRGVVARHAADQMPSEIPPAGPRRCSSITFSRITRSPSRRSRTPCGAGTDMPRAGSDAG